MLALIEPENLEGQLMFREMYYAAECAQGLDFGQIRGNSICRSVGSLRLTSLR